LDVFLVDLERSG